MYNLKNFKNMYKNILDEKTECFIFFFINPASLTPPGALLRSRSSTFQ